MTDSRKVFSDAESARRAYNTDADESDGDAPVPNAAPITGGEFWAYVRNRWFPGRSRSEPDSDWAFAVYEGGAYLVGFVVFVGSWIYCIATYGFLLGVGLGWLPSLIVAWLAGALWPIIAGGILALWLYSPS